MGAGKHPVALRPAIAAVSPSVGRGAYGGSSCHNTSAFTGESMSLNSRLVRGSITALISVILALGVAVPSLASTKQSSAPTSPARAAQIDVTGVFQCNDGGTYYVRVVGDQMWWYGENGNYWTNVFEGTISGNTATGTWADVPKGQNRGYGLMTVYISAPNLFYAIYKTGGFGGSVWYR